MTIQYDFFDDDKPFNPLHAEIIELRSQLDHHRKSFFARHNQLSKLVIRQQEEIDRLRDFMIKMGNK